MNAFELPHAAMTAALRAGAPAYLCVDPVEYHGPHLSLRNDGLISRALCEKLHARLAVGRDWPFLFAGELPVGVEPVPGPGSRHTPLPEVRRLVREACRALAEAGAQRVVLMTFHGSPLHSVALHAGVVYLESLGVRAVSPMSEALRYLGRVDAADFEGAIAAVPEDEQGAVRGELSFDLHAGFLETSVALHLVPESVSPDLPRLPPCASVTPESQDARPRARRGARRRRGSAGRAPHDGVLPRVARAPPVPWLHGEAAPRERRGGARLRGAHPRSLRGAGSRRLRGARALAGAADGVDRDGDARWTLGAAAGDGVILAGRPGPSGGASRRAPSPRWGAALRPTRRRRAREAT